MQTLKRMMAMCLAGVLVVSPVAVLAEEGPAEKVEQEVVKGDYMSYAGKIKSLSQNEDKITILVEGSDENRDKELIFHIGKDVKVFDMTLTRENKRVHLKEGAELEVFFPKNTPVAMSMPAQLTPEVVVVKNAEEPMLVKVDKFDENLLSSDGQLVLNLENKENYGNKVLLVYYDRTTKSIPAQAAVKPENIVVIKDLKVEPRLEEVEESQGKQKVKGEPHIVVLDKIKVNGKVYKTNMYRKATDVVMVPLRDLTDIMGHTIKWQGKTKPIEISKGIAWTAIEIGKNQYTYGRTAPFHLESEPELVAGVTYVPVSFVEKVLGAMKLEVIDGLLVVE